MSYIGKICAAFRVDTSPLLRESRPPRLNKRLRLIDLNVRVSLRGADIGMAKELGDHLLPHAHHRIA